MRSRNAHTIGTDENEAIVVRIAEFLFGRVPRRISDIVWYDLPDGGPLSCLVGAGAPTTQQPQVALEEVSALRRWVGGDFPGDFYCDRGSNSSAWFMLVMLVCKIAC